MDIEKEQIQSFKKSLVYECEILLLWSTIQKARKSSDIALQYHALIASRRGGNTKVYIAKASLNTDNINVISQDGLYGIHSCAYFHSWTLINKISESDSTFSLVNHIPSKHKHI